MLGVSNAHYLLIAINVDQQLPCASTPAEHSKSMRPASRHICLVIVLLPYLVAAADVPIPEPAREAWNKVLNALWLKAKPQVAFCLGEGEAGVIKTMLESFPNPLPTEPADDAVCSNATRLGQHLCGPKSLMEYYKVRECSKHSLCL